MPKLNEHSLLQLVSKLQKGASYRESIDLSYFLNIGITQAEIGMIDYVQDQLTKCPYLEEKDFIEKGISHRRFEHLLGGFENFKKLLGIKDFTFAQWLSGQDLSKGLAVPYFLYQKFADEIKNDFMVNMKLCHYLSVELSNAKQYQYISIHGVETARIPATNLEAAVISLLLLCLTHRLISLDKDRNLMVIEERETTRKITVEVKCLASKLCERTDISIVVIDDLHHIKNMPKLREIVLLQDLI